MRYLGIDYGQKRIGLAVGDDRIGLASPLTTVDVSPNVAQQVTAVLQAAGDYDLDAFVIGLPLNMDDSEGPQAKLVRAFGTALGEAARLPVHYLDERLSSYAADELMGQTGLTHSQKKRRRDRLAAQVILQEFLDQQG